MANKQINVSFPFEIDTESLTKQLTKTVHEEFAYRTRHMLADPRYLNPEFAKKHGQRYRDSSLEDPFFGIITSTVDNLINAMYSSGEFDKLIADTISKALVPAVEAAVAKALTHYANKAAFTTIQDRIVAEKVQEIKARAIHKE